MILYWSACSFLRWSPIGQFVTFLYSIISYWPACLSLRWSLIGQPCPLWDDLQLVFLVLSNMISYWSACSSLRWSPIGQPGPLWSPIGQSFLLKDKILLVTIRQKYCGCVLFSPYCSPLPPPPRQQPALPRDLVGWGGNIIPYPWRIILRRLH